MKFDGQILGARSDVGSNYLLAFYISHSRPIYQHVDRTVFLFISYQCRFCYDTDFSSDLAELAHQGPVHNYGISCDIYSSPHGLISRHIVGRQNVPRCAKHLVIEAGISDEA
jgi:hypothetical protein